MKRPAQFAAVAGAAIGFTLTMRRVLGARRSSLDDCDARFHDAYGRLRAAASRASPVLVLFGESLILLDGDRRREFVASAACTHVIKAVAHLPVGIFATLAERAGAAEIGLDLLSVERLSQLQRARLQTGSELGRLDAASRADVELVFEACHRFLEPILRQNRAHAAELARFASAIGPVLVRLIDHATRYELAALHEAVEAALRELSPQAQRKLEVVVAGVHQARARSLGLQYFQKRFGEAPGEERRVAYAEAASSAEQARDLVGVRRLDRVLAEAFFEDATRLQRDLLGDAAARLLAGVDLAPISPR